MRLIIARSRAFFQFEGAGKAASKAGLLLRAACRCGLVSSDRAFHSQDRCGVVMAKVELDQMIEHLL